MRDLCEQIRQAGGVPYYCGEYALALLETVVHNAPINVKTPVEIEVFGLPKSRVKEFGPNVYWAGGDPYAEGRRHAFTVCSILINPFNGCVLDNYVGQRDIASRTLVTLADSNVDALNAMQLAARFGFRPAHSSLTETLCKRREASNAGLSWYKWASLSRTPSDGIDLLFTLGWLDQYPQIKALINCPQNNGDCYAVTMLACNWMASYCRDKQMSQHDTAALVLATLCHKMGVPKVLRYYGATRWNCSGYVPMSVHIAEEFLNTIDCEDQLKQDVLTLVRHHEPKTPKDIKKLVNGLPFISVDTLMTWLEILDTRPEGLWEHANASRPIVNGYHVMEEFGVGPGPHLKPYLKAALDGQIAGKFKTVEDGLQYLKEHHHEIRS